MTNLDTLIEQPEAASSWAKNFITKKFFDYLRADRDSLIDRISQTTDPNLLCGLAGELRRLDKILELPSVLDRIVVQKQPPLNLKRVGK